MMVGQPAETDVRELFSSCGIRFSDKGAYYFIFCPFHDNKKTASAFLYKDRMFFKCAGCDAAYPFAKLYEELKGKPWGSRGGFSLLPPKVKDAMPLEKREAYAITEGRVTSVYDNAKALAYCRSRGVSDGFMKHFDFQATELCKFKKVKPDDPVSIWQDRLLIPINLNGKPYSLEGRDYTRKQTPKCLYPKHGMRGICFNQDGLDKSKPLVVCEGVMDIHTVWSHIDKNITCTFGKSLSEGQKAFLKDAQNLVLFIDDDAAGHGSVSLFEKFMLYDFKVAVVPGTDPGGASLRQIERALEHAVNWVDFLAAETGLFDASKSGSFLLLPRLF